MSHTDRTRTRSRQIGTYRSETPWVQSAVVAQCEATRPARVRSWPRLPGMVRVGAEPRRTSMAGPGASPHEQPAGGTAEASTSPARAGLVLLSLILVAAVANLNLAVANVALPEIGQAFDSSQTTLEPRGGRLLPRPGRIGALPRCGRRPLRAQAPADCRRDPVGPCLPAGRLLAERHGPGRGPRTRRALGGHGLPDHPRADHRLVVRPGRARSRSRCGRLWAAGSPRSVR